MSQWTTDRTRLHLALKNMYLDLQLASQRQRSSPQNLEYETIFDQKRHDPAYQPAIFTRSRSARLLFVPPNEKNPQRKTFCGRGRGEDKKRRRH